MKHCIDSGAILAWLDGEEPAAAFVEAVVSDERPAVSWINLAEVESRLRRDQGAGDANETLATVRERMTEEMPSVARMRAVAAIKAEHPIAMGACFAVATAAAAGATLITDDPEIIERAGGLPCRIHDVR